VLIEDAASGQSLIQELAIDTDLPVKAVKVGADKVSRAAAAEPTIEAGRVMLPEGLPWVGEFLAEVCAFPAGAHDDQVDALVQAINYLRSSGASYGNWASWARSEAIAAVAERESPAAAAERFDLTLDEVEHVISTVGDYEASGQAVVDYYIEQRARFDPDNRCYHCQLPLGRMNISDNGLHRFHAECARKRLISSQPV
jgi:hypothetical protein